MYRGRYKTDGMPEMVDIALKCRDKVVAQKKLNDIIREKELELGGIIAPKANRDAANSPLLNHLDAFLADLGAKGRSESHMDHISSRVRKIASECNWTYLRDISVDSFQAWRTQQSLSAKTKNEYLNATSSLLNWLVAKSFIVSNPLKHAGRAETRGNERVKRRAFTAEEFDRLLDVSASRAIIYLTAVWTGLRRGELEQLRVYDVHLNGDTPHIKVRAAISKNKEKAHQPLHPDVVAALRAHIPADASLNDFVFPGGIPRTRTMIKDCAAAGVEYIDKTGRKADFHALRNTFCTRLLLDGVPPRVAMKLMRHSDLKLTASVYADADQIPGDDLVKLLPSFGKKFSSERSSQIASQKSVQKSPDESTTVQMPSELIHHETLVDIGFGPDKSGSVRKSLEDELVEVRGVEPLTF
jgi:integrase